jgi:hypothetical protein
VVASFGATYTSLVPAHAASPVMGAVLPMSTGYCGTPTDGHRIVVIHQENYAVRFRLACWNASFGSVFVGNSQPECQARFGHRASNPKRFWSFWQRLFDVFR